MRNSHVMTVASAFWPRHFPALPAATDRLFEVEPGTQLLGRCHWQRDPNRHPTIVLVHGLEGSSESPYMLGIAEKAYLQGFNAVRMNQRNCGGTEGLTPTLYNSGLSGDYWAVLGELMGTAALPEVFLAGYSMGGNLVLKLAGELGEQRPPQLRGVCAVCPAIDLAACARELERASNFAYQWHFVRSLKRRMRLKASLFPSRYDINGLDEVRTVREFDEVITAPWCGFRDAADYYARSSANQFLGAISVPTLILAAQNDPFIRFDTFGNTNLRSNPQITVVAPREGGHCAFISRSPGEERYWAEARVVEFCKRYTSLGR
ncbi:MAG: alpha/beta fold hydrolase [Acidobacteria bacterium]|nr:alpha/beta fold hydrolase [Acidobacteriota bacterium]